VIFAAIFTLVVGVLMILQWTVTIIRKQVAAPGEGIGGRGKTEMVYHWVAEFATSVLLIIAAVGLFIRSAWGLSVFLIADGLLIYTVINSPGYFAQQRQWAMVAVFGFILILASVSLVLVLSV